MSIMGVLANCVDHIYYPLEKICWFSEHKLINVENPSMWDTLNSLFWLSSIYLNLMKFVCILLHIYMELNWFICIFCIYRTVRLVVIMESHKRCIDTDGSRYIHILQITKTHTYRRQIKAYLISIVR